MYLLTATHSCAAAATTANTANCLRRYAYCPNLTIIDTPGFILKVRVQDSARCWLWLA
jgi:hypothetical protein